MLCWGSIFIVQNIHAGDLDRYRADAVPLIDSPGFEVVDGKHLSSLSIANDANPKGVLHSLLCADRGK